MSQAQGNSGGMFSFFQSKGKSTAGGQQQNGQQQQQQQQQNNANPQNANNQQQQQNNETRQLPDNPLDAYAKLWENVDDKANKAPEFNVEDKVLNSRADSLDFMYGLPEDLANEIQEKFGDNAETLGKLLNHIGRRAYSTTMADGMKLSNTYINARHAHESKQLGGTVRNQLVKSTIDAHEAAKKHPIVRESLQIIGERIARQYPDATPQEVQEMSIKFFTDVNGVLNPQPSQQQSAEETAKSPGGEDFDWGGYLKGDAVTRQRTQR